MVENDTGPLHPERKEIARYLLSRGLDPDDLAPEPARLDALARAAAAPPIGFPAGLAPRAVVLDPAPSADDPLPAADAVVITWTVDELAGLALEIIQVEADIEHEVVKSGELGHPGRPPLGLRIPFGGARHDTQASSYV